MSATSSFRRPGVATTMSVQRFHRFHWSCTPPLPENKSGVLNLVFFGTTVKTVWSPLGLGRRRCPGTRRRGYRTCCHQRHKPGLVLKQGHLLKPASGVCCRRRHAPPALLHLAPRPERARVISHVDSTAARPAAAQPLPQRRQQRHKPGLVLKQGHLLELPF